MSLTIRPLSEVSDEAITVLTRELGLADTLRFLGQFKQGTGNYTEEREALLGDLTLEEIFARARRLQAAHLAEQSLPPD